jgi:aminoglycoside phosphotransferase family enzyme/predicted kinase
MELTRLIDELSQPGAYPHPVAAVDVRQTHISVVFLAGAFAYKLKKPVDLGFLDFSTLDKRRHYCDEEVRLNRRLAPSVYLGVVPITVSSDGVRVGGDGEVVDWVVQMERLPEGASLLDRLRRGEVEEALLRTLAERVAGFHERADRGSHIADFGRFEVVAGNARENFAQSVPQIGVTVSRTVFDRLRARTEEALVRLRPLIDSRAAQGVPCDTHGDLHLDHVYHFPGRAPPDDLVVIDCVEFNERFRYSDPVADAAFLAMDLIFRGRRDLAEVFSTAYFRATGDAEGATLLPFYIAYRAAIRGKVEGLQLAESEIPQEARTAARRDSRARWLLALGELEAASARPALVLIGGLPGSGKSTLARALANRGGFTVIRSDVVRKELAGLDPGASARDTIDRGIYTPQMTEQTYAECLRRAEEKFFEGGRVIVDANFGHEVQRRLFLDAAARWCVPAVFLVCRAGAEVSRGRITGRTGDASDADAAVYQQLAARWQSPSIEVLPLLFEIDTEGSQAESLERAANVLRRARLING